MIVVVKHECTTRKYIKTTQSFPKAYDIYPSPTYSFFYTDIKIIASVLCFIGRRYSKQPTSALACFYGFNY